MGDADPGDGPSPAARPESHDADTNAATDTTVASDDPPGATGDRRSADATADRRPVDADRRPADSLDAWTYGAFHTTVLTGVGVLALHLSGALGDLLGGLSTGLGLLLYALLWATTFWSNRWLLRRAPPGAARARTVLAHAAAAGALTAGAFLLELIGVALGTVVLRGQAGIPPLSDPVGLLAPVAILLFAFGLAGVVGAVIGVVLAGVDLAVVRAVG